MTASAEQFSNSPHGPLQRRHRLPHPAAGLGRLRKAANSRSSAHDRSGISESRGVSRRTPRAAPAIIFHPRAS
eukprot:4567987-Alexandrium_andersonii.AAC.1